MGKKRDWHRRHTRRHIKRKHHRPRHIKFRNNDDFIYGFLKILGTLAVVLIIIFFADIMAFFNHKDVQDIDKIEARIFELVNMERSRYGANPLQETDRLNEWARDWSNKMIEEDFFEHSSEYNVGENIAEVPKHYHVLECDETYSNEGIARCFVTAWINSPGHHANMIDKGYRTTGIGVACDESKCRATQMFV